MNHYVKPPPGDYFLRYAKPSPQQCLAHHGILGQRWGKRNGPPYPLATKDHSASEKKAGWQKSLDKIGKSEDNQNSGKVKKKEPTSEQEKAVTTALATYGKFELKRSGKLTQLVEVGKRQLNQLLAGKSIENRNVGAFSDFDAKADRPIATNEFKSLNHKETIREAVTKVNPSKSRTNCRACSIASVLRTLGMDVEAIGSVQGGTLREAVEDCFKGAKVAEIYSPTKDRIMNFILKRCGEGSSGVMSARYQQGSRVMEHAISWAIKDGTLSFFDGQKGLADCSGYLDLLTSDGSSEIVRIDNLELDVDGAKKYIKNC